MPSHTRPPPRGKLTPALQNRQLRRMAHFPAFFLIFLFAARRRMASRFYPTPNEMNVKRGSSRPPSPQKTKEKLKNPQQPTTRAVESQEGLKPVVGDVRIGAVHQQVESQEGLKQESVHPLYLRHHVSVESQEGLKLVHDVGGIYLGGEGELESQEGLKPDAETAADVERRLHPPESQEGLKRHGYCGLGGHQ
jgi:hypothetical protein